MVVYIVSRDHEIVAVFDSHKDAWAYVDNAMKLDIVNFFELGADASNYEISPQKVHTDV